MTLTTERPQKDDLRTIDRHAARVQNALATSYHVTVGGVTAACDVQGALGAGGDIADLIEVDGGLLAVLGDVSGKGAPASLVAAMLLSSVQHHAQQLGTQSGLLLAAVGRSMSGVLDRTGMIVTLVVASIDPATRLLRVASAGHHPVLVTTAAGTLRVEPTCPPLGAATPCSIERVITFEPGARLVLASDGITEQPDARGDEFGLARLQHISGADTRAAPEEIIADVLAALNVHAGTAGVSDDRALVVLTSGMAA